MAVTGRGTQDDPYIVHDYYELRETFPKQAKDEQGEDMGCDYEDYPLKDCKITGSIIKSGGDEWILTRGGLRNCIIDLEISRKDGVSSSYTLSHYSNYSISNKDKLGTGISSSTTTGATSEQIVNGDWLRGQGFPVVNVSSP